MNIFKKTAAGLSALCLIISGLSLPSAQTAVPDANAAENVNMKWDTLKIGGGGFVSGIVTGQKEMYLRTDVGGAYKYNYETAKWEQMLGFINDSDRGLLSVSGIAIDPTDDNTIYLLCGCAYFSDARTVIFKSTDGGKTFSEHDVTNLIQCHANGDGRECSEPIAVDPDNPDVIYAGGDVASGSSCLIKSTDGGETWKPVDSYDALGMYTNDIKWPEWTTHIARGTTSGAYNTQNGVATIHIENGKVYVGTSITGQTNIHVADVKDDKFAPLSEDLPTANYPLSITSDDNGNLFFTYIAGLAFSGGAGGAFKYNVASGEVTDISPASNAIGMITADDDDPNKLLARTCGVWSDQWYEEEWTDTSIAWGDHFFRSTDGGETWTNITPGKKAGDWGKEYFISEPIDTNGYDWIYGKACHWGSGILLDPRDPDRILLTSGNGVFACDNVWDEKGVQFYFEPDGVEEVVALDMVSVPGGAAYSAIGDYDGFIHENAASIPLQYQPNIGSTSAIAYCPSSPEVMARVGEHEAKGYYSLDAGKTWSELKVPNGGGKLSITEVEDGTYRFIKSSKDNANVSYSDDFGATWTDSTGLDGSKATYTLVDPSDPSIVYGSGIKYNDYWASDTSKTEPTFDECHYSFYISKDYGATFNKIDVAKYDMCDHTGDLAYITDNTLAMAVGWNGLYIISDGGNNVEKTDVFYCKTVGYGAPEKKGDPNTLYIYGKPTEADPEGIYRSQDSGKTWVCINTDHLYGGTGNGNFIVGDMNEFGKIYMSTVGCGIVYGELSDGTEPDTKPTTEPSSESTEPPTGDVTDILYGDADDSGKVNLADAVAIVSYIADSALYPLTDKGIDNADVANRGDGINSADAIAVQQKLLDDTIVLPLSYLED